MVDGSLKQTGIWARFDRVDAALLGVLLLAAGLRGWAIGQHGLGTPYYAAAVFSMTQSWSNWFFAAFDPAGIMAIDKPPVAFWMQTASVALFGFNGFALHLPQLAEGVATVGLIHHLTARRFGRSAGLLAALFLAVTPIAVAVDRGSNTDSCLVFLQTLAAWPMMIAAERGSLRHLLAAAAILGLAFLTKMAAALLVLPAFVALYFFTAPLPGGRRIVHLLAAAAVLAAVSLSWPLAVDLTPPDRRPAIDSSPGNSVIELIVGHNALDRFRKPDWFSARRGTAPARAPAAAGPDRLANRDLASQIGWLGGLALAGLIWGGSWPARLLFGGWALVAGTVFSLADGIFVPYYLVILGPPLAVLAALGLTAPRRRSSLIAVLAGAAVWQAWLAWGEGPLRPWLAAVPLVVGLAAIALSLRRPDRARAVAVLGLIVAPAVWSLGPVLTRGSVTYPLARLIGEAPARTTDLANEGLPNRQRLRHFLAQSGDAAPIALLTTRITEAASIILTTGRAAVALGGFSGATQILDLAAVERLVAAGGVRFALIDDEAAIRGPALRPVLDWIAAQGRGVDPARWRPPLPAPGSPFAERRIRYLEGLHLYDLGAAPG